MTLLFIWLVMANYFRTTLVVSFVVSLDLWYRCCFYLLFVLCVCFLMVATYVLRDVVWLVGGGLLV